MDKIRSLISTLLGLLGLVALAMGLSWLFGPQGLRPGQQVMPTQQVMPIQQVSPLRTPTPARYVEPTAPSEDWPTLTPPPTRVMPTSGPTVVKPTPLPTPTPTPLPLLPLPPIPEGETPDDLWSILYLPLQDELAVHGVLVDAQGRRWSDPQVVYDFRQIHSGRGTYLANLEVAPTGDWLSVIAGYFESGTVWLLDLSSQEARPVSACEGYQGCRVRDWSPDGKAIILELYPFGDHPFDFVMVDVDSDTVIELHIPETALDYASVEDVTFSPDRRFMAWIIKGWKKEETTEIWLTDGKGELPQLLTSQAGQIWNLAWHPDGSQVAYSLAAEEQRVNVRVLSIQSREDVLLVPSADSFSNPVWSPDGLKVAMTQCDEVLDEASLADQKCNISVLDRHSGLISPAVVHPGRVYWGVSWSPDAGLLAFLSASDKELQAVWLFSSETGKSYPVSGYLRSFSEYAWLPFSFAGER